VAVARKLAEQGRLTREGATVLCITGNGLKTPDAVSGEVDYGPVINARLSEVVELAEAQELAIR
jgi:threonine synthase